MARLTLTFFSVHHACVTLLYVAIGAFLPDTRLGHLMSESGHARALFAVLCLLCLLALVDAIGIAISPFAGWARSGLHGWIWRLKMLGQAWLGLVALRGGMGPLASSLFFLGALGAGSIAYLDLRERADRRNREVDRWDGLDG